MLSDAAAMSAGIPGELMYRPYARAHNTKWKATLEEEIGKQLVKHNIEEAVFLADG